jgi:hypothetical protein
MLKMNKLYVLIAWAVTCFLFYGVATHADEWDQSTKLTFDQPIQIPGRTLPAGTYLFKLSNVEDRNFVQIFNADGTALYGTYMTIPTQRFEATDDTDITLVKPAQGGPDTLEKWFYAGERTGHEFIYPKHEQEQLAQGQQQNVVMNGHAESGD